MILFIERMSFVNSFSPMLLLWYIFPVIVFFASNYLYTTLHLRDRFNIRIPDITVPFLIIGMHEISKLTYGLSILPYILLTILCIGIAVVIFQAIRYREILYRRFFKMFWRLAFLVSFLMYFVVIIASIVSFFI
ncbi:DUF3397 domain-containing protein [Enterococcus sp. ALS3]|uniref:DUF3397 domain-containing protein n=2 Tax=Enterococcus TaxID=1350 RepID=A0ABS6TA82_9ENTE|nr:DUF3397 domain-containing protein [Enterococcus alishanensis]MBV7389809.1 DUF3397 domain-containing protein [Enterococcus alishanensis]